MVFSPVVQCTYLTAGGGVAEADGVVEVERVLHRVGGVEVVAGHDARVFWTKDIWVLHNVTILKNGQIF